MHYCYVFFFLQIQSQSLSLLKCLLFSLYVKLYNIIFGVSKMEKEKKNRTRINLFTCFSFDTCLSLSRMHRFFFLQNSVWLVLLFKCYLNLRQAFGWFCFCFFTSVFYWFVFGFFFLASTLLLFFPQIYIYYAV